VPGTRNRQGTGDPNRPEIRLVAPSRVKDGAWTEYREEQPEGAPVKEGELKTRVMVRSKGFIRERAGCRHE
jgi:hypothetical protein